MANLRLSTAARNALANQITALVDAGTGPGVLNVYSGTQPANADTATTGTLLISFTLADPAVAAAVAGVGTFDMDPAPSATAVASGTPTHFRITDSAGNVVIGGDAGPSDATLTIPALTAGGAYDLTTGSVTMPAGA